MKSTKWIKPSAETITHFERIAPGAPLETRSMFGMPCRFLNGHMLVGVFQNSIMLRLSEEDRALCIAAGANPFRPMGREMKGYVELSPTTFDDLTLKLWIVRGMRFIGSLAPKLKGTPQTAKTRSRETARKSAPRRAQSVARTATARTKAAPVAKKRPAKPEPRRKPAAKPAVKRPTAKKAPAKRQASRPKRRHGKRPKG